MGTSSPAFAAQEASIGDPLEFPCCHVTTQLEEAAIVRILQLSVSLEEISQHRQTFLQEGSRVAEASRDPVGHTAPCRPR